MLLHACCAPCTTAVLERLASHFSVTLFYYNPNIAPQEEHDKRLGELERLVAGFKGEYPVGLAPSPPYAEEEFLQAAKGMEGEPEGGLRCTACFRLRLAKTAAYAAQEGFQWFGTTLSISPHKNAPLINEIGQAMAACQGVNWLPSDFKKQDGYRRSVQLSKEMGLYRQNYCGCRYSLWQQDGGAEA